MAKIRIIVEQLVNGQWIKIKSIPKSPVSVENGKSDDNNSLRNENAKKALIKVWVAGTYGAFFAAFTRSIPVDWAAICNNCSTVNDILFLKYGYSFWFLIYFVVSNINNEQMSRKIHIRDIIFDIIHSILALIAAHKMGLFSTGAEALMLGDFQWSNISIISICLLSLAFYLDYRGKDYFILLNVLRFIGAVIGLCNLLVLHFYSDGSCSRMDAIFILKVNMALVFIVLIIYTIATVVNKPQSVEM